MAQLSLHKVHSWFLLGSFWATGTSVTFSPCFTRWQLLQFVSSGCTFSCWWVKYSGCQIIIKLVLNPAPTNFNWFRPSKNIIFLICRGQVSWTNSSTHVFYEFTENCRENSVFVGNHVTDRGRKSIFVLKDFFKPLNLVPFTLAFSAHPGVFTSRDENLNCSGPSEKWPRCRSKHRWFACGNGFPRDLCFAFKQTNSNTSRRMMTQVKVHRSVIYRKHYICLGFL